MKNPLNRLLHRKPKIKKGQHLEPIHHYHVRKRVFHKDEPYPHPDRFKRLLDRSVYFVGVIGPIMTLPQLYMIWHNQNAEGVSIWTWGAYGFVSVFWFLYGTLHDEKPIVFTYSFWILVHAFVITGIILYG